MMWISVPIAAIFGYLMGSVPVGVWVTALFGVDIRKVGSGRTGATNAWRAAGLKAAIPTVLGDALKGAIAVLIVRWLFYRVFPDPDSMSLAEATSRQTVVEWAAALAGAASIIGHNWSLFLGFKGGAGGITSAATTFALDPIAGGIVWIVGALMIWWSRIASVGTFAVGATAFAVFLINAANQDAQPWKWAYTVYGIVAFFSVLTALHSNRQKLKDQQERIITIW